MPENAVPDGFEKVKLNGRRLIDPIAILPKVEEQILNAILDNALANEKLHPIPPQSAIVTLGDHAQGVIVAVPVSQPKRAVVRRPVQVSQKFKIRSVLLPGIDEESIGIPDNVPGNLSKFSQEGLEDSQFDAIQY